MKINMDRVYVTVDGEYVPFLGVTWAKELEDFVVDRAARGTGWTEQEIYRQFDPYLYLWGNSVKTAIFLITRDCARMDAQRDDSGFTRFTKRDWTDGRNA